MKEKGFTLIELLAVIVILAIIALIAVPIVLNIIEDAKNESNQRSIDLYGTAVKNAAAKYQLNYSNTDLTGKYDSNKEGTELTHQDTNKGITLAVEYDGARVYCETIEISSTGEVGLDKCKVNGNSVDNSYGEVEEDNDSEVMMLSAGLYDESYNLLVSWENLISTNYTTINYTKRVWQEYMYVSQDASGPILTLTNGSLSTNLGVNLNWYIDGDTGDNMNYSSSYLDGHLILSNDVTELSRSCFHYCEKIKSITIPKTVTYIDSYAFAYNSNTTAKLGIDTIYYKGTMTEWNAITKSSYWNENCHATVVHCTDGDVTLK